MSEASAIDDSGSEGSARPDEIGGVRGLFARYIPEAEREPLWRVFAPVLVIGLVSGAGLQFFPAWVAALLPNAGWAQAVAGFSTSSFLTDDGTSWLVPVTSMLASYFVPWFIGLWLCLRTRFSPPAMAFYAFGFVMLDAVTWLLPHMVRLEFDYLLAVSAPNALAQVLGVVLGAVMGFGVLRFVDATLRPLGSAIVGWIRGTDDSEVSGDDAGATVSDPARPDWSFLGFAPASAALRRFALGFLALVATADALRVAEILGRGLASRSAAYERAASPLGVGIEVAYVLIVPIALAYVAYRVVRASGPRSIWLPNALGIPTAVALLVALPFNLRASEGIAADMGASHFTVLDRLMLMTANVGEIFVAVAPFVGVWLALRAGVPGGPWAPDDDVSLGAQTAAD